MNANSSRNKRKRQHNIISFNPSFSKRAKTNLGKKFFKLLKHFPKRHKMSKIFNKNTVKLSYSCCRNISFKISSNNRRITKPQIMVAILEIDPTAQVCNFIKKEVGDDLSVCVLNLEFLELKSGFIRNVFL